MIDAILKYCADSKSAVWFDYENRTFARLEVCVSRDRWEALGSPKSVVVRISPVVEGAK